MQPQYESPESYRCLSERLPQNVADWFIVILDDDSPTKSVLVETIQPINHRKQFFLDLCPSESYVFHVFEKNIPIFIVNVYQHRRSLPNMYYKLDAGSAVILDQRSTVATPG